MERISDRQIDKQKDRQTDRQKDRQTAIDFCDGRAGRNAKE
jgi:hypothetical protein